MSRLGMSSLMVAMTEFPVSVMLTSGGVESILVRFLST